MHIFGARFGHVTLGLVGSILIICACAACGPDLGLLDADNGLYLSAMTFDSTHTGWAVGVQPGSHHSVLLRQSNGVWQLAPDQPAVSTGDALTSLAFDGATLWIAGSNTDAAHGNADTVSGFIADRGTDGVWHRQQVGDAINAITFAGSGDGWAVGEGGIIVHEVAGVWKAIADPMTETLDAVAFRAPNDGWAVGEMGTILHYVGNNWQDGPHLAHDRLTAITLGATEGWIVGMEGRIFHFDGSNWYGIASPVLVDCYGVAMEGDVTWIVGEHGSVFMRTADGQWQHFSQPADQQLNFVAVDNHGTVWTAGNSANAALYALKNGNWQTDTVSLHH